MFGNTLWNQSASFIREVFDVSIGVTTPTEGFINQLKDIATSPVNWFSQSGNAFMEALIGIFGYLPDGGTLPAAVHEASQGLGSMLYNMSFFFPVYDLLAIIALTLILKFTLFVLRLIVWGIAMVRGSATAFPI